MAQTVVLDTRAFNQLVEGRRRPRKRKKLDALRASIRRRVEDGSLEILCSSWVVVELMGTARGDQQKYERMTEVLIELTGSRILAPREDRIPLEIRQGRLLSGDDRFARLPSPDWLTETVQDRQAVAELDAELSDRKCKYLESELRALPEFATLLNKNGLHRNAGREAVDLIALTEDSCRGEIEARCGATAPLDARAVPSLWSWFGYSWFLRREYNFAPDDKEPPKPSDYCDTEIFCDAAYADILITDDHRMSNAVASLGLDRPQVIHFREFARLLGVNLNEIAGARQGA